MTHHTAHPNAARHQNVFDLPLEALGQRIRERKEHYARQHQLDIESWRELAELGFWRAAIPQAYGGYGGTWQDFGPLLQKLAIHGDDFGFLLFLIAHAGLIRILSTWGTERQKREFLPKLCNGAVGATAITEPHAGSDIQKIATQAQLHGDSYRITGQKVHITNGPSTDIFLVVTKTPGTPGKDTSLFIVEAKTAGIELGEPELMMGNHTSPTGPITLQDVVVGRHQLLGSAGEGLGILLQTIALDRALYAIAVGGILENVLAQSLDYTQTRIAFNAPIIKNQYLQKRLTDIKIAIDTSLALGFAALDKIVRNDPETVLAGSLAKLVATESLVASVQHFMIVHGHTGYEHGSKTNLMCDALGTLFAGGTSDIQRVSIFNQMMRIRRQA
jgi:isovaleryl-CoA dehydrogenase